MAVKVIFDSPIDTAEMQKRGAMILADILKRKLDKKELQELKTVLQDKSKKITM